jgi:hypothetical protein
MGRGARVVLGADPFGRPRYLKLREVRTSVSFTPMKIDDE